MQAKVRERRRIPSSILAAAIFIGAACDQDTSHDFFWRVMQDDAAGPSELSHQGLPVEALPSRILTQDEVIGIPARLRRVGSRLLLMDAVGDPALEVFDAESGRLLGTFGRRGGGPGEFFGHPRVVGGSGPATEDGDRVWLHDQNIRRLLLADLEELRILDSLSFRLEEQVWDISWRADSTLLGLAQDGVHALVTFDDSGKVLRRLVGDSSGWARIPPADRADARSAYMCSSPDGAKVALAYRHAGRVELYSADGDLLARARAPHPFEPWIDDHPAIRVKYPDGTFSSGSPNHRAAYYACAASRQHVFALFSGRLRKDFVRTQHECRHVHVFDWSGRLVRVIGLDHGTGTLEVDPGGSRLYTGDLTSTVPAIRVTELHEDLRR